MSVAIKKSVANPHGGGIVRFVEEKIDQPETHPGLKCKRCGHEWNPKKAHPLKCPSCQNPGWDRKARKRTNGVSSVGRAPSASPLPKVAPLVTAQAEEVVGSSPSPRFKIAGLPENDEDLIAIINAPVVLPTRLDTAKSQAMSILERLI
jgi:hypothetical protein